MPLFDSADLENLCAAITLFINLWQKMKRLNYKLACKTFRIYKLIKPRPHTYFAVYWCWWEWEGWCGHEDRAVVLINVIQQRCERLIKVTVTGWSWWHSQGHPTQGGVANWSILTAHAAGATPEASCSNDQGQLEDQLLTAWNVDVDLEGKWFILSVLASISNKSSHFGEMMIKLRNAKNKKSHN